MKAILSRKVIVTLCCGVLSFFVLSRCVHKSPVDSEASTSKNLSKNLLKNPGMNLTRSEAMERASIIEKPEYDLEFVFKKKTNQFQAKIKIQFEVKKLASSFLDANQIKLESLQINSQKWNEALITQNYNGQRISLPETFLKLGKNEVIIEYQQNFSKNGRGIYKFTDPLDNKEYIWTKLEPFEANQVFPCFDQPDLKALISAQVITDKDSQVVFTTKETKVMSLKTKVAKLGTTSSAKPMPISSEEKLWIFPKSVAMSTYLFSLHVGPYHFWKDRYQGIPLRLFVRDSLKTKVDSHFWFQITKKGFAFFEKEFAYPYPFKKYDQLIVPDFSAGGMENIAAVNYNEAFVPQGIPTEEEQEKLANVMLHEMAHMWFGDLVTMKWWDDLWLNESFATYMAYLAIEKITDFKGSYQSFHYRGKSNAYTEDQYPTTHPVSTEVPDLQSTYNQFDAITYSKGAATMRQLAYYMGEEDFRAGIRAYFKKYQYQNTEFSDFISSLEVYSKKNLKVWSEQWIKTAGVDTLKVNYKSCDSKINFKLISNNKHKSPSSQLSLGESIRPHQFSMNLYDSRGTLIATETILMESARHEFLMKKPICAAFILVNANDKDYVKVSLIKEQLSFIKEKLNLLSSPLERTLVWNQLYFSLRDHDLKLEDFSEIFLAQLPKEKNIKILHQLAGFWSKIIAFIPSQQVEKRKSMAERIEAIYWEHFEKQKTESQRQIIFEALVAKAESAKSIAKINDYLDGKLRLKQNQELRWSALRRLATFNFPGVNEKIESEKKQDPSELGVKLAMAALASRPSKENKQKWLDEVLTQNQWSLARKQSVLSHLFPNSFEQNQVKESFREFFFTTLQNLNNNPDSKTNEVAFNKSFTQLAPNDCSEKTHQQMTKFIEQNDWHPSIKKNLIILDYENELCRQIN